MELITVLMSAFNETESDLKSSIDSILNQSYRNIEYIIVNDNPTNESLSQILENYQKIDQRIRIVKNEKNIGLVNSLNRGWQLASGEYIARMDADDIALTDRLEKQLAFMKDNHYDFVGAGIQHIDEASNLISAPLFFPETPESIRKLTKKSNCVPHPTWLMKKSVMQALNGYRNIPHCEDFDFVLRAQMQGFKLGNMQELGLYYRIRANGISLSNHAVQKLTARYLARNWNRIESCNINELKAYLDSKEAKQYFCFESCQMQGVTSDSSVGKKALRLFCKCWNNRFFWIYIYERICNVITKTRI